MRGLVIGLVSMFVLSWVAGFVLGGLQVPTSAASVKLQSVRL